MSLHTLKKCSTMRKELKTKVKAYSHFKYGLTWLKKGLQLQP